MMLDAPTRPGQAAPDATAALAGSRAVLHQILHDEVNLAVWQRRLPHRLGDAARPLVLAAPFCACVEAAPDVATSALLARLPARPAPGLIEDIADLAHAFAAIAGTPGAVRVRLEAITGPACHRWHADAVGLRLLCTYRGAGTEWLPLGGGAAAARDLNPLALPVPPRRLAAGDVAIMKGERLAGNAGAGCIHRSPPAGVGGRARLLLCIDEPGRIPLE
jgi:hypothetical protein